MKIREEIRDYILKDVNKTLERLGVSEKLYENGEEESRYYGSYHYNIKTDPIRQFPMIFRELIVEGYMTATETKEGDRYHTEDNDLVVVRLSYRWAHFDHGTNGTDIGVICYHVEKDLPETFDERYNSPQYYVRKVKSIEI